jgi:pilus assembly protein CpaB
VPGRAPRPVRRLARSALPARQRLRRSDIVVVLGRWPRRILALTLLLAGALAGLRERGEIRADRWPGDAATMVAAARDLAAGTTLTASDVRPVLAPVGLVPAGAIHSANQVVGRVVSGAMRRGEPLTDARLVGAALAAGLLPPATVAVPVRLADAQAAALLRAGDRIDILASAVDGVPVDGVPVDGVPVDLPGRSLSDAERASAENPPTTPEPDSAPPSEATGANQLPAPSGAATTASALGPDPGPARDAIVVAAGVRVLAVLADRDASTTDGVLIVVAASDRVARRLTAASARARLSVTLRPP